MIAISTTPAAFIDRLSAAFIKTVNRGFVVRVGTPILLGAYARPRPHLVLLRYRPDAYREALPGPEDVLVAVEVVDCGPTGHPRARLPLYSRFGIPASWLVDPLARTLEVHTVPGESGYAARDTRGPANLAGVPLPAPAAGAVDLSGLL